MNGFSVIVAIFLTAFSAPALIAATHDPIVSLVLQYYGEQYVGVIVFVLELLIYPAIFFLARIGLVSSVAILAIGLIAKFI